MSILDKMMRIAGRDNEGKARAIKTDNEGKIITAPQKGESEVIVFSKDNPLSPRVSSDYEPRTAEIKTFALPHLIDPYSLSYHNIFDQSFLISSSLDADIAIEFSILEKSIGAETNLVFARLELGTIFKPKGGTPSMMLITPEKSTKAFTKYAEVVELPELRQPYPAFRIDVFPLTAPTTGEIKILNTRRY